MMAAMVGHLTCLQLLVDRRGAEVNVADQSGLTAYRYAANKGHQDCMDGLSTIERSCCSSTCGMEYVKRVGDGTEKRGTNILAESCRASAINCWCWANK